MYYWCKFTNVSEVLTASILRAVITLIMEAIRTSETLVNLYQRTWRYNPEENQFCTHLHENV
jgi:hypothetical protein